jgi:hypothetical protein
MEKTIFNENGEPVAYIANDYNKTIYLWDGSPVAYLYEEAHVYGINGRHLGWFIDEILYNNAGERMGFTSNTCPMSIAREPAKSKKQPTVEMRPRWSAPPFPKLSFSSASQDLVDFLKGGQVAPLHEEASGL